MNVLLVAASSGADFAELVRAPESYHRQTVRVTGVARVEGLTFELYANGPDAKKLVEAKRAIFISAAANGSKYDEYDNRWVTVDGRVDAYRRGTWGYACVIFLDRLQLLPVLPAGEPFKIISGVFRNDDSIDIDVTLFDQAGKNYAEFSISAHGTNGTGLRKGIAELRGPNGRLIARHKILTSKYHTPYRDGNKTRYYFRILNGGILDVPGFEGHQWSKPEKEAEDKKREEG